MIQERPYKLKNKKVGNKTIKLVKFFDEETDKRIKTALGGLTDLLDYEMDGIFIKIWAKKTHAFNLTYVTIDNMIKRGFKLYMVTLSNDYRTLFGGRKSYTPMLLFIDKKDAHKVF